VNLYYCYLATQVLCAAVLLTITWQYEGSVYSSIVDC